MQQATQQQYKTMSFVAVMSLLRSGSAEPFRKHHVGVCGVPECGTERYSSPTAQRSPHEGVCVYSGLHVSAPHGERRARSTYIYA